MNKNALLLIPLALVLSGCGGKPDEPATAAEEAAEVAEAKGAEDTGCETRDIRKVCLPIQANPKINLNTNSMKANPNNGCVKAGSTVEFRITPDPGELNTVEIWPKVEADTWLAGWNSEESDRIFIKVPSDVTQGTDHDYGWTDHITGKCVDPRVRVDDTGPVETQSPQKPGIDVDETLDENAGKVATPDD